MGSATRNEIEYLGSIEHGNSCDPSLVDELWHRLEALRFYDQNFQTIDRSPDHSHYHHGAAWRTSNRGGHSAK
jgi:hypothetical protein